MDSNCRIFASVSPVGNIQMTSGGMNATVCGTLQLRTRTRVDRGIPMITTLELGQSELPDPDRPSLILRRAGQDSLWSIAKACGTTVEAIQNANGGIDHPKPEQMLLIPMV